MNVPFRVHCNTRPARATRGGASAQAMTRLLARYILLYGMALAVTALGSCSPHADVAASAAPAIEDTPDQIPEGASSPLPVIELGPGIVVDRHAGEVRVEAEVAADRGWLEQAVCKAGTREHESLLAVNVVPSRIHAALLILGIEPGAPGEWRAAPDGSATVQRVAPSGAPVELWVRFNGSDVPLSSWICDPVNGHAFPLQPWVFAGSRVRSNTKSMGPGEHYVADRTGSVVGIVTFGDEMIACTSVLSDQVDVDAPEWQAHTERMPEPGTRVELVIRRAGHGVRAAPAPLAIPATTPEPVGRTP